MYNMNCNNIAYNIILKYYDIYTDLKLLELSKQYVAKLLYISNNL